MTETLVVAILSIAALVAQEVLHRRERKDLLNRIMSRDYRDYQAGQEKPEPGSVSNPLLAALKRNHDPAVRPGGVNHGPE